MAVTLRALLFLAVLAAPVLLGGCAQRGAKTSGPSSQYVVQPGDTLVIIGARFGVGVRDIVRANRLRERELTPGQILILPGIAFIPAPPPARAPEPAPEPAKPAAWFIPRSQWSVRAIDTSNIDPMTPIYRLTVHHSGEETDVLGDAVETLRHFEKIHQQTKGWACIGYHFIITPDGRVFEGRPLKYQGAHAVGDNNIGNIGVCLIGDFNHHTVPYAQRVALTTTLDRLSAQHAITRDQIFGHKEFKATDCPGVHLWALVEEYRGSSGSSTGAVPAPAPRAAARKRPSR